MICRRVLALCDGIDGSISAADLNGIEFRTASAIHPGASPKRTLVNHYCNRRDESQNPTGYRRTEINVDSAYDFFMNIYGPYSSEAQKYHQPLKIGIRDPSTAEIRDCGGFTYFEWEMETCEWLPDLTCLIDAIRLFKLDRAGIGIVTVLEKETPGDDKTSIGVNDTRMLESSKWMKPLIEEFDLSKDEAEQFSVFLKFYREWFFNHRNNEKNRVTMNLIRLFREAYRATDYQSALIINSALWETFTDWMPNKRYDKKKDMMVPAGKTYKVVTYIPRMILNGKNITTGTPDNLFLRQKMTF